MPLVFTVENSGRASVTLQLLGRTPAADFRIADSAGRTIWSRLHGQTMLGALRLYPLDAGKSLVFREHWRGHADDGSLVAPGDYLIRGVLLTDDPDGLASPPVRVHMER